MEALREDPDRGLLCIDWNDQSEPEISIIGDPSDDNYSRFEVILVPCNYVHTMLGYVGDSINPECIGDL